MKYNRVTGLSCTLKNSAAVGSRAIAGAGHFKNGLKSSVTVGIRASGLLVALLLLVSTLWASVPAGYYYPARDKKKAELKTALSELAAPLKVLSYGSGEGATWQGFYLADRNPDNSVIDMYSNINRTFDGFKGISGMHIEHSLPKSWWGGASNMAYRDLFHLYPSDGSTNSSKSNHPLGIVTPDNAGFDNGVSRIGTSTFTPAYTGKAFEPADEFKGDFARSYLYISTIYEQLAPQWTSPMMQRNTYPVWTPWARDLLMQWHAADPVSIKERLRQEAIYAIQGNRNPYIDYPELVSYIWGADTTRAFPFPDEPDAFLVSPRRGTSIDFDLILQGDTVGRELMISGRNFTGDVELRLKNQGPAFVLRRSSVPVNELLAESTARIVFQPTRAGTFRDTLVLEGGGLAQPVLVPLEGKASRQLMALEPEAVTPVGATLHWITDPRATGYEISVTQGAVRAGNLLISAYVEGSSYNKAIEIYNGTGSLVQLADYALAKQSNGTGAYESVFPLKGELPNGQSVVIINKLCSNDSLKARADMYTDSVMNFNGNDAIAVLHNNLRIDAVGFFDAGPELEWGLNKTLHRKAAITHPTTQYNDKEWIVLGEDDFSPLRRHEMQLSSSETLVDRQVVPAQSTWYTLEQLQPETEYLYQVSVLRSGVIAPSVNSVRFRTLSPEIPVPLSPESPGSRSFTAAWESDLYADQFELQVYTIQGSDTVIVEGFEGVGASGKPLPAGWTGTASGNYTAASSSGVAPPSVALKNTGEWLQSPEYPYPVSEVSFMHRFPSGAGASYFLVEARVGSQEMWRLIDSIPYVNTSKLIRSYFFSSDDALRTFRITYGRKATTANLSIDDWRVKYGNRSNVYLLENEPVSGTGYEVGNLEPQTDYFFRVRSAIGESRSAWSDALKVTTLLESSTQPALVGKARWRQTLAGIELTELEPGSRISIYSLTGQCAGSWVVGQSAMVLPVTGQGVYILSIQEAQLSYSFKLII